MVQFKNYFEKMPRAEASGDRFDGLGLAFCKVQTRVEAAPSHAIFTFRTFQLFVSLNFRVDFFVSNLLASEIGVTLLYSAQHFKGLNACMCAFLSSCLL